MAKLFNSFMKRFGLRNAPTGGGGSGGTFNRDPKAIQVKRVGYQLNNSGGGGRDNWETPDADFDTIARAIQRDSYIMQAVMKYKELIFKSGWSLQGKNEQALEYLRLRLEMMAIATRIPTEELFQGIADDIVRYSNSFIAKSRLKGGQGLPPGVTAIAIPPSKDPVGGYFRLPPSTISVARDKNGTVTKYQQTPVGGGDPIEFKPEDIIHIYVNKPAGKGFGDPFLASVLEDVRLLRKVEENAALLLYRHIFPLLSYTVGLPESGFEATDEELAQLRAEVENMPTDGAIILPERHKIEAVQISAINGEPYLKYFEQRVFTGLGMSQVDMGRGDTANRNTADAMGGIKADRVKGWQQALQMQIDKYIIEELLVEGGFDPLLNIENNVDFVFNEIEQEARIKADTHEIFKFEHNVQTFEETRKNMGMEPVADEPRLHFQMIAMVQAEHQSQLKQDETNNKQKPSNQSGTRSGPKRSTESVQESFVLHENVQRLHQRLVRTYEMTEMDLVNEIQKVEKRKPFPMKNPKTLLSSYHFAKKSMMKDILEESKAGLLQGALKAKKESGRSHMANFKTSSALQVIEGHVTPSFDLIEGSMIKVLEQRLKEADNAQEAILSVRSVFESLRHRLKVISKTTLVKSYNLGFVLSMMYYQEKAVIPHYEGSCPTCLEKSMQPIYLDSTSSLDELTIYSHIPSWHPNCDCHLELYKGGEGK